ncbi:MAG TPA: YciI family protein [Gaiellaceae bacterium]|nr:YciI family protein [Gaiellaceae bacterium]
MKYAALLTNDAADAERWKSLSEDEAKAARELEMPKWNALFAEIEPYVRFGAELDEPSAAKTVRVRDGEVVVTDGPYAEAKELIGGLFVFECDDLDQAIALAEKIPLVHRGSVELRPLVENPVREEQVPAAS